MSRKPLIAIAAVASLALAGVAYASIPGAGGVIHGCYAKTSNGQALPGALRVVDTGLGQSCQANEVGLNWNQQGPKGATGPQGPAGPPGPSGTLAWAHVAGDGTILASSGNVNVFHFFAGGYCVGVTGGTPHAATAVLDSRMNVGGTIQASVFHASGCPADATGIYIVTRPQFQDGGQPGADRTFYFVVS
jgi:hypothetical protein